MTEFLLKLCGLRIEGAGRVSEVEFAFRNTAWLGWVVALGLLLIGAAWFSYWRDARELTSRGKRRFLTSLRMLLFLFLLLLLLRPVIAFTVETAIRRGFLTLVDSSGSMKIRDPRFDDADLKRAAIAKGLLDPRKGLAQPLAPGDAAAVKLLPRIELARGMLHAESPGLLKELGRELDLASFTFGKSLAESATPDWLEKLDPTEPATALGDSIRDLLNRKRGQALAGIFVVTDGASNTGAAPLDAARLAKQEGVPLFIYGTGITSPRDIIVGGLLSQEVAFVNDELPVSVRVRGQGLKGERARLVVKLVPVKDGTAAADGEVVGSQDITFAGDEDLVIPLPFTPKTTGDYELRASIEPRDDEASRENNAVAQRLRVVDSRVKVLYVETAPRWEFRFLQTILLRDRRLDAKFVLLEADPGIAEGPASPYLARVPASREELFKFDLIILGDIGPRELSAEQLTALEEYVQKLGGCMVFIAGPRSAPSTFAGSVLEKLIPVELDDSKEPIAPADGIPVEITPQGRAHPMLQLAGDDVASLAAWRGFGRLYWAARVLRVKPGAQVLLVDGDAARANRHGKLVLAAEHQFGLGRVLWMGTDNTWRWRRNTGERFHGLLWGQIAQKLGLHHLLGGSKRTQLTADKQTYTSGDRVTVFGRLYDTNFTPIKDATVEASYIVRSGTPSPEPQAVTLRAVPDQPGMYRAEFAAALAGTYQFSTKNDPASVLEFHVNEPRFESGETAMNEAVLRQMAEASGGAFFREENLHELPKAVAARAERVTTVLDGELWSSPLVFLLILALASAEWLLRKRWQLK